MFKIAMPILIIAQCFSHAAIPQEPLAAGGVPAEVSPQVQERLLAMQPDAAVPGARAGGDPVFYGENLYEYINGGAEAYHLYDFVALLHREYKAPGAEITVDIYDMGAPLGAFGIYSAERSPDYSFLPIGAEGYVSEGSLNFLQDRYYVKLSAFSDKPDSRRILEAFARGISEKIGAGKSLPRAFDLFPRSDRVLRSEKFVLRAPLGHDFLSPAYLVTYRRGEQEFTLVLSEALNPAEAVERSRRLREHFAKSGKAASVTALGPAAFRGSNSYEGEVLCVPHGIYAILALNPPPGGEKLLEEFVAGLPKDE